MQRIICSSYGDPEGLQLVEESTPAPNPGEVLIETKAIGVSFVDGLVVRGAYQVKPPLPFTPGNCLVGVVIEIGANVDTSLLGTRVATVLEGVGGAYASHVVVKSQAVAVVPASLSSELAASIIENYLTITFASSNRISISKNDEVVVLGAGGGIGLAAIDLARSKGAHVTAVASTDMKRALAVEAGAETVIGYENLKEMLREKTGGGADIIIDPVGGDAAESAFRALKVGGRYCVLGFASGKIPRFPANVVLMRNRSIIGVDWGDWSREIGGPEGNVKLLQQVFTHISIGALQPQAPTVVPMSDAGRALRLISDRKASGRYVLKP